MGFSNFAGLTHEMENVLDGLRSGALNLSSQITNVLLRSIDALQAIKDSIASGDGDVGEVEDLTLELKRQLDPGVAIVPQNGLEKIPESLQLVLREALETHPVLTAKITLRADCSIKFARVFMAIRPMPA